MVGRAMGVLNGSLDPHFANWPHLYMYVSAAWLALLKPLFPLFGPAAPYLGVRLLDAVLGTATILLLYRFGRRAYGELTGLLAALFLALAFLPVRDSHFATIDIPLTLVCVGGLDICLSIAERDRTTLRLAGGALLGLAAGVKYNGALLVAGLAAAETFHLRPRLQLLRNLLLIGATAALAFLVTSPFLAADLGALASAIGYIFHQFSSANQPEIGYLHIPHLALWYGLDPPLFLLVLAGVAYALLRRTAADRVLLAFVLIYYATLGAGFSVFARYSDPLLPPLLLLAARFLIAIAPRMTRPVLAGGAAVAILVVPAVAHDLAFDRLITQQDTRTDAFDWLAAHVPAGSRVAMLYFAGPAHDQVMVDRRDQSHGAADPYVASFLQNRLETRYTIHEIQNSELSSDSLSGLLADNVAYVVYSPIAPRDCPAATTLHAVLASAATVVARFAPTSRACTDAVFDPIDAYFVPFSGYSGWERPGPPIEIYRLPASSP